MHPPRTVTLLSLLVAAGCAPRPALPPAGPSTDAPGAAVSPARPPDIRASLDRLATACAADRCGVAVSPQTALDTTVVDTLARRVEARFSPALAYTPWTDAAAGRFEALVADSVAAALPGYTSVVTVARYAGAAVPLADLVLRDRRPGPDGAAQATPPRLHSPPLVRRLDATVPARGLAGRHVALWPSHGWYFEPRLDRWEWQRARLFTTIEDLHPFAFVVGGITPMLERAGAVVMLPRERDTNPDEALADGDASTGAGRYSETGRWTDGGAGFRHAPPYDDGVNPFRGGRFRQATDARASAEWILDVPRTGDYAVSVSYGRGEGASPDGASTDARFTVHHAGGATVFAVNQAMGGGTWVPLGTFRFAAGTTARVALVSGDDRPVSADAVRIGGGVGNVARGGQTSGRPRYTEAARYHMQFAGFPDSTVYNTTRAPDDDYRDDYRGRGEWVNELRGAPFGPNGNRESTGFGIPVELSLAFHTDAGVTTDGSTVGTLAIYNSLGTGGSGTVPDGVSRLANRDLMERIQTEIVRDIRAGHDPDWTRRPLWDRDYSEAARPNVPSALLELMSHQNFADMRVALDPRFRFTVARAVYKAVGRFLAGQRGEAFVVQPLAPTHLSAEIDAGRVRLRWQAQPDSLEPSADPTGYVVYTRDGDPETGGWDDGHRVAAAEMRLDAPPPGVVRSYRVAATNDGGESAPSAALAVGLSGRGDRPLLVVDGFDRVSGPATVDAVAPDGTRLQGFRLADDPGVPDGADPAQVGDQYDFDARHAWTDDDAPGWGSSTAEQEGRPVAGNRFDYAAVHGRSILAAGRSFVSASDEAVESGTVALADYPLVHLALGLEKRTPWPRGGRPDAFEAIPAAMRRALADFLGAGGKLVLSGAHWATDTATRTATGTPAERADSAGVAFLHDALGVRCRTDRAALSGRVVGPRGGFVAPFSEFALRTERGPDGYAVRNPDAVEPADSTGATVLRFAENNTSAAVARRGPTAVVAFGFPLDAVESAAVRDELVRAALRFLGESP